MVTHCSNIFLPYLRWKNSYCTIVHSCYFTFLEKKNWMAASTMANHIRELVYRFPCTQETVNQFVALLERSWIIHGHNNQHWILQTPYIIFAHSQNKMEKCSGTVFTKRLCTQQPRQFCCSNFHIKSFMFSDKHPLQLLFLAITRKTKCFALTSEEVGF